MRHYGTGICVAAGLAGGFFSGNPFRVIGYFVYHPTTVHKNLTDGPAS